MGDCAKYSFIYRSPLSICAAFLLTPDWMKDDGLTLKLNIGWPTLIPDPVWIWILGIGELLILILDCAGLNPIGLEPPGLTRNLGIVGLFWNFQKYKVKVEMCKFLAYIVSWREVTQIGGLVPVLWQRVPPRYRASKSLLFTKDPSSVKDTPYEANKLLYFRLMISAY